MNNQEAGGATKIHSFSRNLLSQQSWLFGYCVYVQITFFVLAMIIVFMYLLEVFCQILWYLVLYSIIYFQLHDIYMCFSYAVIIVISYYTEDAFNNKMLRARLLEQAKLA